ncbi:hypothetical protein F442_22592 [Phytophthora nicotianae P10297]|uniref:Uncharacterized protein n=1 Tax=Phytophthora nicotianae P10297 TaxID=1317064 RepID=W2XZH5_PHYNI|nr:hypothetical protein F442_22592 [Phytophthora nicotianae P10297]
MDGSVFVDLTSSPCSSPRSAARGGPATVSTVELADLSLDLAGVRASLSALQQVIDQTEALRELRSNHEVLRREFLATRRRAEDLDRQLADAANAASHFVLFCQHKYEVVRHQLESTRTEHAECLNALLERLDNSRDLEACRLRYHDLQLRYREAVSEFQDRISTLEAQLAAAFFFGVIVPPDTARRIADLESQLARSQSDLQVERDRQSSFDSELRESATSHKAAQAEVDRLTAAIKRKTRRFRTLRDNYERRLKVADNTIATHSAELDRLQDRVSTLDQDLQRLPSISRWRFLSAIKPGQSVSPPDRVSAARDTIARLEKQINQVEKPQKSRQDLELALAALQQERDGLVVQRVELLGQLGERFMEVTDLRPERDQAQERLPSIESLFPSALGHKRSRSESDSPAQSARVSKGARSTSGPFPAGALSQGPASTSSIEVLSAVAAGQKYEGPASSPPFAGPPDHLSRSARSTVKGGHGGASSSPAASDVGAHSGSGESSSGKSSSTRVFDSDAVGSDSGSPELSRARDQLGMPPGPLSDAELADLPPTTVPRSEWIPGYRDRRSFRSHDIVPWSAQDIRQISIVEMDADLLFHQFAKPMEWLIPLRDSVPPLGEWRDDLVDESNVRDLIESAPWEILAAKIDRLTFRGRGWFRHMMRLNASYEDEHLRAYWDSTHAFPMSITKRRASRYLDGFCTDRKQHRSRAGARWKSFLQQVLIGALAITNAADRWRNHFRNVPADHPSLGIARLPGKFVSFSS